MNYYILIQEKHIMIIGRAPLRISFAGGGTDLEEYHKRYDGFTVSFTINKFTWVIAKTRGDNLVQGFSPDFASHLPPTRHVKLKNIQGHEIVVASLKGLRFSKGIDMYLASDVEPNSGLGASSSLTSNLVNVISAIQQKRNSKSNIAMKAYHIGHDVLNWGIGKQDEFAAVYGGLNSYKYSKNKVTVSRININKNSARELEKNSLLFRLGNRKHSVNILKKQIKNINESNNKTLNALHDAKNLAMDMRDALKENDLGKFGELLNKGWEIKKQYASGITNTRIDRVSKKAFDSGAISLKVTGAGGGGHLFVYAEPKKHKNLESNLKKLGVTRVHFSYHNAGATVFNINNL